MLCHRCAGFDLEGLMGRHSERRRLWPLPAQGIKLGVISDHSLRLRLRCPLCHLLGAIRSDRGEKRHLLMVASSSPYWCSSLFREVAYEHAHMEMLHATNFLTLVPLPPKDEEDDPNISYSLTRARGRMNYRTLRQVGSTKLLDEEHEGASIRPGIQARLLHPCKIEWEVVTSWLKYCADNHTRCRRRHSAIMPALKVIDCVTRSVVDAARGFDYVALSYVWGASTEESLERHLPRLPRRLPLIVRDAITVALKLDFRYLWVDRYCISGQMNDNERHSQICNMDLIYSYAQLTIVAAAGDSPTYGLPGVSTTKRTLQPSANVHGRTLISTMSHPTDLIYRSKWHKRAWCLQEALLSRRKLVFTTEQVYYECKVMRSCEGMVEPLDFIHDESKQVLRHGWLYSAFHVTTVNEEWLQIHEIIEEYSKKQMTYESDGLNAIAGILRMFSRKGIISYWGIPLEMYGHIPDGLLWNPLCPLKRRAGDFPSWSWVGWNGPIQFRHSGMGVVDRNIGIWVETQDGSVLSWKEFVNSEGPKKNHYDWTRYIYLEAWTIQIRFQLVGLNNAHWARLPVKSPLQQERLLVCSPFIQFGQVSGSTNSTLLTGTFDCVILGWRPDDGPRCDQSLENNIPAIVLHKVNGVSECLGRISLWQQGLVDQNGKVLKDVNEYDATDDLIMSKRRFRIG